MNSVYKVTNEKPWGFIMYVVADRELQAKKTALQYMRKLGNMNITMEDLSVEHLFEMPIKPWVPSVLSAKF